ncbi:MAG: hypothetical protein CO150_03695 [Nitrospirae bacterium CG_4_9_14_3_um_filter_53_35]|nr:MAG: hypothetical protein AUK29_08625 [Nitrospirae bacterium CG2_30_53_67]PIS35973.1 MAG: hypothetical protein COT35_13685 [Nitrospirae bacterium CG08_land_8_20_14_0_20_52_24]PIV85171.1 MAG: hypothetical protein COW52_03690 [Nitrospirae bacterium CG17_big_fil_post_rev_8_21_14_2_50_50_9]PIW86201.1 MAG: hypothetical protein COZ95_00505 [Nitrospirae bacterium CG_4_8_14_3_um_filter_50_41]PIX84925.1 MAG: hypothetical protein COZ32_11165 [Nitrospirae bacterium CG_4_10_14_3_um_filter_53_41]PJA7614
MRKKEQWEEIEKGKEEDYFLKKHREWLEKKAGSKDKKEEIEAAPDELLCPLCKTGLKEDWKGSFRIQRCRSCGGGWLDQEGLEKLSLMITENR